MECCSPNRRQVLATLGLMAAVPVGTALAAGEVAAAPPRTTRAVDLEVVTVTDTSVVITWATVDTATQDRFGRPQPVATTGDVWLGSVGGALRHVYHGPATPFHYAEIDGLEPGREYQFVAKSQGRQAVPTALITSLPGSPEAQGRFRTLVPPPGHLVRTLALANDVHMGESTSGLIIGNLPPGFTQDPGLPPYPEVMLAALLADSRARGCQHLLLAGDLTAEAEPRDVERFASLIDDYGTRGSDYLLARGNHDRPHVGADWASCPPSVGTHHDCMAPLITRQRASATTLGGLRIVGLDTTQLDGSGGELSAAQLDDVAATLRAHPDQPTIVFGHHPITRGSAFSNLSGPGFVMGQEDSLALQRLYQRHPGVFLHHAGHTHRNKLTAPDLAIAVEFLEVGAVKEYPGGFARLRLYTGGYMVNFYKTRSDLARRWSQRSRGEYFGLLPEYVLGTVHERNHVVRRDLSGIAPI